MTDLSPSPPRGAPPGNTNALKHGFYSRAFQQLETSDLADLDPASLEHEIQLLRVFIRRVAQQGEQVANLPESMALLAVLSHAAISLAALLRTHRAITAAVQRHEFQDFIAQANNEIERANLLVDRLSHRLADLDSDYEDEEEPSTSPADSPESPARPDSADRQPKLRRDPAAPALPAQAAGSRDTHPPAQGPARTPSAASQAGSASLPPSARIEQMLLSMLAQVKNTQANPPAAPPEPHPPPSGNPLPGP
jgi:hypothetical protein